MFKTSRNLLLLILLAPLTCFAQERPVSDTLPDTPTGKLAQEMVRLINNGDKNAIHQFVAQKFGPESDDSDKREAQQLITAAADESKGVKVSRVRQMPDGGIAFMMTANSLPKQCQVMMRKSQAEGKIGDFMMQPAPAPSRGAEYPDRKMSPVEVKAEVEKHFSAMKNFSGAVIVARDGEPIYQQAFGMAERSFQVPNRLETRFRIGSMPKMFTAVAIAQLVQAGKLSFDEKLAKALPEYPNKDAASKITLAQLLTHTSGLGDFFSPEFFAHREKYMAPSDYYPLFADKPLLFEPGKGWSYSNAGFVVLGAVIEKASGEDYFDYVRNHIFSPAGMKDTDTLEINEVSPNTAVGYTLALGDPFGIKPERANWTMLPAKGSPAGGATSTVSDLIRFSEALRQHKLLNPQLTEMVITGHVDTPFGDKYGYGFMDEVVGGHHIHGHNGGAPGMNAELDFIWENGYAVAVLSNEDPPSAQLLARDTAKFLAMQDR